jgi:hypothetical protein
MSKKEHEQWVLSNFLEIHKIPVVEVISSESPDFIVRTKNRLIGVEIAKIFKDDAGYGSLLRLRESVHREIGYKIIEKTKLYTDKPFALNIHFNDRIKIDKQRKNEIVTECLSEILFVVWNNDGGDFRIINMGQLPVEINDISIYIDSIHWIESHYVETTGGVLGVLTEAHLQPVLNRHHEALIKYRECDEYWLVIEEGSFGADSFGNIDINKPITSLFDKVFVYRIAKHEAVCLK